MGLLKGTWTFSRFRILGNLQEQLNDLIDEGLKKNAFSDFMGSLTEKAVGWTDVENILDTDFAYAKYKCGPYLIFALRVDRKTIPAALLKIKVMEAEKKYMAESGKKRIHRHEHEDIKERILSELLGKSLAVPSLYEICWSPLQNTLIFGSHSEKAIEEFQKLFKESFHLTLLPFLPWELGNRNSGNYKSKGASLADSHSSNIVPPVNLIFKGREFLTWLWFKSEERNGIITIPDEENEVLFLQRLVLASGDGEYSETVVCQGLHADMKEGKEALRRGKKIKEARLRVLKDEVKWDFTFKADMFQFQSLKLPAIMELEDETDREGRNLERIYLIERIITTIDRLFAAFLQIRNSPQWAENELPRMEKWVNE
jgi:recombination associated protein RdgC